MMRNPWTAFFDWFKRWVDDIRSTNLTIVTGLIEGFIYVIWALAAATWAEPIDENTLDTVGLFIAAQITGGVIQFATKRATDRGYVEAKTTATVTAQEQAARRMTTAMPAVNP